MNSKSRTIRKYRAGDLDRIMELWLEGNEDAHRFAGGYWRERFRAVRDAVPRAQLLVCEMDGVIEGFVGRADEYVAGLFVGRESRSQGIGKALLDEVKKECDRLFLHVYEKNGPAVRFYLRERFVVMHPRRDEDTGETELVMVWRKGDDESGGL